MSQQCSTCSSCRELSATLVEEPPARIHQLMEPVPGSLHRKLQINVQATSITRGSKGLQARNQRDFASIHIEMDNTEELSRGHIRQKRNRRVQARLAARRIQGTARGDESTNTPATARASKQLGRRRGFC